MRVYSSTRFAAMAIMVGALACARNKAETDETAAARDTTTADTTQNPPGYRGMERDTTMAPPSAQQPSDTFLQNQGQGQPQDTTGYSGAERVDTTGQANPSDTTGAYNQPGQDTTGAAGAGHDTTGMAPADSSWKKPSGDTTGYNPSQQQPADSSMR
jgi:hypothetical protein